MGDKFGVAASTAYEKVNTTGTDENLFRLVPVPGHDAQMCARAPKKAMFRLCLPGHGHQV